MVHVATSHPGTWLEQKSTLDNTGWERVCAAPCDKEIVVQGVLLRATATGMTTSNAFRVQPGPGVALVKVEGGSSSLRLAGVIGLAGGLPIAFTGMTLFGYGTYKRDDDLRTTGAVVLGVGAVAVLAALPLLMMGGTDVRDGNDTMIALLRGPGPGL